METHLGNCCYNPIKGAVQGVKKQRYYCTSLSANTKIKKWQQPPVMHLETQQENTFLANVCVCFHACLNPKNLDKRGSFGASSSSKINWVNYT